MGKLTDHVGFLSEDLELIDNISYRVRDQISDKAIEIAAQDNRDVVSTVDVLTAAKELGLERWTK
jgi:histone H3/H4